MNQSSFPKIKIKGKGKFIPPPSLPLTRDRQIGEIVNWESLSGQQYIGELKEWDSNVAIVDIGGKMKAVEC